MLGSQTSLSVGSRSNISHGYARPILSQRHTWRFYSPIAASPGVPRAAIANFADHRDRRMKSPISGMSDSFRYRRLNSPAFVKCARFRDFLRSLLRIASKANPSGLAILSHDFSKLPHRRDRRKKSPSVSASIGGEDRLRFSLAIKFAAIGI